MREVPLDVSFCVHALLARDLLVVPDARLDARFEANPLVTGEPHLRAYAGALLKTAEGVPFGTLCVLDTRPRNFTGDELKTLQALSRQVMAHLELRRALLERRSDEARARQILDSAVDYAIIAMDRDGLVTSWNEGAHRIFGHTVAEVRGRSAALIFTPEDRADGAPEREMALALAQGRAAGERWHLRASGERFWASGEVTPLRDDAQEVIGFVKLARDRTHQRLAAEALTARAADMQRVQNALNVSEEALRLATDAAGIGTWDLDVAADGADLVRPDSGHVRRRVFHARARHRFLRRPSS